MGLNLGYKSYCGQLVDHYNTCVNVGKYSSLGFNLVLLGNGANHPMNTVTTFPLKSIYPTVDFPTCDGRGPIEIGNDVWIGHDVKLLDNLTVHDGAIVGAGAVVTKSIPPYAIAVGVPAKVIRYRFEPNQIEKLLKIKWWDWPEEKIIQAAEAGHFRDINLFISLYYTL